MRSLKKKLMLKSRNRKRGTSTEKVRFWKLWARALGEKASTDNKQADKVALIRTIIVLYAVTVDTFILLNILYGWFFK